VESITSNVSALTSVFSATLGGPVIKIAAFSYGVRRAASRRNSADIAARVRTELTTEKAAKKSARKGLVP
jgi:anthranilate phosphoribosyltransferase